MARLHVEGIPPARIEELNDTPAAGDVTTYIAYAYPSKNNGIDLNLTVIKRIVEYANIPAAGDSTISVGYADGTKGQLEFDKVWASRAGYTYLPLSS